MQLQLPTRTLTPSSCWRRYRLPLHWEKFRSSADTKSKLGAGAQRSPTQWQNVVQPHYASRNENGQRRLRTIGGRSQRIQSEDRHATGHVDALWSLLPCCQSSANYSIKQRHIPSDAAGSIFILMMLSFYDVEVKGVLGIAVTSALPSSRIQGLRLRHLPWRSQNEFDEQISRNPGILVSFSSCRRLCAEVSTNAFFAA
jgi:hypothetical protein